MSELDSDKIGMNAHLYAVKLYTASVTKKTRSSYHHGNLRQALLAAALELVREQGVGVISLREVARRAGVSHAAPAHHFGDKAGLLTALAAEGFEKFGAALRASADRAGDRSNQRFAWVGWGYVMFAAEHRAYFEIMFRPELLHYDDPQLAAAAGNAYSVLTESVRAEHGADASAEALELHAISAWSQVHGLATLWLHGNLPQHAGHAELDRLARKLFGLA